MRNMLSPLKSISPFTEKNTYTAADMLAVFSSGVRGVWDMTDKSTLFQDTAGTVPVTASGQPVGRVNDISGNGAHIIQSTAGARPIYTEDSNGKYVLFDGIDDALQVSLAMGGAAGATFGAGVTGLSTASNGHVVDFNSNISQIAGSFSIRVPSGASQNNTRSAHSGPTTTSAATVTGGIVNSRTVLMSRFDLATPRIVSRVNSRLLAYGMAAIGATSFGTANLRIGRSGTGTFGFNGRMYAACVVNRVLSDGDARIVEEWLNAKVQAWL